MRRQKESGRRRWCRGFSFSSKSLRSCRGI